jgi:L-Ala-D/L-Glu epimerase
MKLTIRSFDLPLAHTFTIAYSSRDVQDTLIVELQQGAHTGYGEATAVPYYGFSIDNMTRALENIREPIEASDLTSPEAFWARMQPLLADNSFALCALDMAANDLYGKLLNQPIKIK